MQIVNAGVSGWIWDDLEVPGVDTVQIQDVDPINSWGKIVDFGCRTTRNINDVFFWNNHLAFFVGDGGFLCRYSLRPDPHGGPGLNIAKALLADRDPETKEPYLKWEAQGADEQALNWGKIVDEPAYRYANFRSVFCLQVGPINIDEWVAFEMNADLGGSTPHSNLHPLILTLTRTLTPTLTRTLSRTLTPTFAPTLTPALTSPCCPLQARKLAGIASDGMVLCASDAAKTSLAFVLPPARTHRPHPIPPTPYHPPHTTTLSQHPVPPTPSHHPLGSHAPSPDRPTHPCPAQAGSKPGDRVAWAGYEGEPETPKQMDKKKAPS